LAFKHNPDGHFGACRPGRSGFRTSFAPRVPRGPLAALAVVLALAPAPPAGAQARAQSALPDSVVARTPLRDLTVDDVRSSWLRLDPQYRPPGSGEAQKRAFVEQLLEKEAMAREALAVPFVMTERESAQFVAFRNDLERRELYRVLVVDSAVVLPVDRDSARARMVTPPDGSPIPAASIESAARDWAERRRADEVEAGIKAAVAPAFDDAVAERLAQAYAAADSTLPNLSNPMQAALGDRRRPRIAPADSAAVLAQTGLGPLTVGEFVRRFAVLNPFNTPLPTTAGTVKARSEQFLGQMWFDAEVKRRAIASQPSVQKALADRRESIALDHWYMRNVVAAIDTSDANLKAHFAKDPSRFGIQAHSTVRNWAVPGRATADSAVAAIAAGAPWDSLCARFARRPEERRQCASPTPIAEDSPDTVLVAELAKLAPGQAYVRDEAAQGIFRIVQLVARTPKGLRTFEEARPFVVRDFSRAEAERILVARMAAAREAMPVTLNEAAIARISLAP